jgi:hypothetical protein
VAETFCNLLTHDATTALGCSIPFIKATEQLKWCLSPAGAASGWSECMLSEVAAFVAAGHPVVVFWAHEPHGHTGVIRRVVDGQVRICAAGAHNFNDALISRSFGPAQPLRYFSHA